MELDEEIPAELEVTPAISTSGTAYLRSNVVELPSKCSLSLRPRWNFTFTPKILPRSCAHVSRDPVRTVPQRAPLGGVPVAIETDWHV
jgi:hypothetical protein